MKVKQKKCQSCKKSYTPARSTQKVCSMQCAINLTENDKQKVFNKETRRRKEKLKPKAQWLKEAQTEFNKFIRLRDINEPCISCGRHHTGQYHAGHYRSVGACPEMRFLEINCFKQCAPCNNHLSGNIAEYRINLVDRYGEAWVQHLEGKHEPLKLTIDDIKDIKAKYKAKCKEFS